MHCNASPTSSPTPCTPTVGRVGIADTEQTIEKPKSPVKELESCPAPVNKADEKVIAVVDVERVREAVHEMVREKHKRQCI
ncbi:hypothetical protein PoB_002008800 [Plakobranchus ocellatus]|uniref:Uncharacterized protein n=1 Tax=Plakobranchus ocellatus TaxID=259542 RepID=A0AAV3ZG63_9GAST|nr:hypothetical protein PoB_002008800 [Plakobranchus ocellatus]